MLDILVTGADGQLGRSLRRLGEGSSNRYLFTDVAELDITDAAAVGRGDGEVDVHGRDAVVRLREVRREVDLVLDHAVFKVVALQVVEHHHMVLRVVRVHRRLRALAAHDVRDAVIHGVVCRIRRGITHGLHPFAELGGRFGARLHRGDPLRRAGSAALGRGGGLSRGFLRRLGGGLGIRFLRRFRGRLGSRLVGGRGDRLGRRLRARRQDEAEGQRQRRQCQK